jgi:glucose/mannose-6-phosphate isomerase
MEVNFLSQQKKVRQAILDFAQQFSSGTETADSIKLQGKFEGVTIGGIGGSALPDEVLRMWLKKTGNEFPLEPYRNFYLPKTVNEKNSIVFVPYSGNPEETISNLEETLKKKLSVVFVTNKGKMGKIAEIFQKTKTPWIKVPSDFAEQFSSETETADSIKFPNKFEGVIIGGVGGSALPGEVLRMWLKKTGNEFPLELYRNFYLPKTANEKNLIVCISYSGNPEETISNLEGALKKKLSVACITSNGKIAEICKKTRTPWVKVPSGLMPRQALGYQFTALVKILNNCGFISDELKSDVLSLSKKLKPGNLEEKGKKLAQKLVNKIPVIYSSRENLGLARIFKTNFNENAKIPAFFNYFPELDHNELAGFTYPQKDFQAIILRDDKDLPKIRKQMEITAKLLKKRKIGVEFIDMNEKEPLVKIFSNIILASWTSYYMALAKKIDPWSIKIVDEFKERLAKN